MLKKLNNDRDKSNQRSREMEGSLGLALPVIRKPEAEMKEVNESKAREEPKKAPIILMEDNLTKAKRALMVPNQLYPTGANIKAIESNANLGELAKWREILIKYSMDYCTPFPKYNGDLKQGQTWCANICYCAVYYKICRYN